MPLHFKRLSVIYYEGLILVKWYEGRRLWPVRDTVYRKCFWDSIRLVTNMEDKAVKQKSNSDRCSGLVSFIFDR